MLSSLRSRVGVSGVVAVIALVFALVGGAYAANKVVISKLNQISPSVQKQLKGNAGPAGPQGPKGDPGATGSQGPKGDPGANGTNGTNGKNGEAGEAGLPGSPWTAGGTLPPGATENGAFAFTDEGAKESFGGEITGLSFTVPLAAELNAAHVHLVSSEEYEHVGGQTVPPTCAVEGTEGTADNPLAQAGHLCVYVASLVGLQGPNFFEEGVKGQQVEKLRSSRQEGASTSGARVRFSKIGKGGVAATEASGTFAVTGCDPEPGATEFPCT